MPEGERKPPEAAHADLLRLFDTLPVERKRWYFHQILDEAKAGDKVLTFDELLVNRPFFAECQTLARGAGLPVTELAVAVNPFQYEGYSADSAQCRIDRYLAGDAVDLRVRVHSRVEFVHTLIPQPFTIHCLEGHVDIVRDGVIIRVEAGMSAQVEGEASAVLRATAGARWIYVDHPLTAWIRQNLVRRNGGES